SNGGNRVLRAAGRDRSGYIRGLVQPALRAAEDGVGAAAHPVVRLREIMSRLRIRMELNRGGAGVPLHKLASVVDEAQKFFPMLGEDVHIDRNRGEWLGC